MADSRAVELDLDTLAPKAHLIRLNGEEIEVSPPKFKATIEIQSVVQKLQNPDLGDEEKMAAVLEFRRVLGLVVPRLKDDDFDVHLEQLFALAEFIFKIGQPADTTLITPKKGEGEKKEGEDAPTS